MYLFYFKQCNALFLYIIHGHQFNFLSKQPSLITHRKKWLILMKSQRELSYILPWATVESNTACVWPVSLCDFSMLLWFGRLPLPATQSQLFWELSVLVHRGASARVTGPLLVSLKRPSGLYTLQVSSRTLVACQRTEVVCVPLKVDTFQIVLHFKATYVS